MKYIKDYQATANEMKNWIKNQMELAHAEDAFLGVSGGTDSLVVGKLLIDAVGPEHVYGIFMPNGEQKDFMDAVLAAEAIGIRADRRITANLALSVYAAVNTICLATGREFMKKPAKINVTPRVRTAVEYGIAQEMSDHSIVVCTANLSELAMGYFTMWADMGSFCPLGNLTKTEVRQLGLVLGLPEKLVLKTPADGLSDLTDEEKLGFKYSAIDAVIRGDLESVSEGTAMAIRDRMKKMEFKAKMLNIPSFVPQLVYKDIADKEETIHYVANGNPPPAEG